MCRHLSAMLIRALKKAEACNMAPAFFNRTVVLYLLNMLINLGVALTGPCVVALPDRSISSSLYQ